MRDLSIYIHIPFCEKKCPYCDFFSKSDPAEHDRYVTHMIDTIKHYALKYHRNICTIYFGGGTPSVLSDVQLISILSTIKNNFIVNKDAEVTIEVNPCTSDKHDFAALKKAGFNRVSVGMQSAVRDELQLLGRRHTAIDAKTTVESVRKAGIDNISFDLMICVPGQTKSSLTESIEFCRDCNVEHISAYILKIEENTAFYAIRDKLDIFNEDAQAQMYTHVVNELDRCGYHQYEISNFSKPGFEGKHNLRYWRDQEYLGIGPSAHSYIDGKRFYYERSLTDFYNNITVFDTSGGDIEEFIMLALRLKEGLSFNKLYEKYGYTPTEDFILRIERLNKNGLINYYSDTISLTTEGFLVSNAVISYLIEGIQ